MRKKTKSVLQIVLILFSVVMLLPVVLTMLFSFFAPEMAEQLLQQGSTVQMNSAAVRLQPSTAQYVEVLFSSDGYLRRFFLSAYYTMMILIGQAAFVPSLAYALSAFRFRSRGLIWRMLMLLMLLPFQVTMVPNLIVMRFLHLSDTAWSVILPAWFSPFFIFLIRQQMITIPQDMYEAAQLDGCGPIRCYIHVALPLSKPVLCAASILSFAQSWNMVEQPVAFLSHRSELQPLSVVLGRLSDTVTGIEFAGSVIYLLPALLLYLVFLPDIINGIQISCQK